MKWKIFFWKYRNFFSMWVTPQHTWDEIDDIVVFEPVSMKGEIYSFNRSSVYFITRKKKKEKKIRKSLRIKLEQFASFNIKKCEFFWKTARTHFYIFFSNTSRPSNRISVNLCYLLLDRPLKKLFWKTVTTNNWNVMRIKFRLNKSLKRSKQL